jgi:hypothetical protein
MELASLLNSMEDRQTHAKNPKKNHAQSDIHTELDQSLSILRAAVNRYVWITSGDCGESGEDPTIGEFRWIA